MKHIIYLALFVVCSIPLFGQSIVESIPIDASATAAVKKGYIPSLKDTETSFFVPRTERKRIKKFKSAPKNFHGRGRMEVKRPERAYRGVDRAIQDVDLFRDMNELFNVEGLFTGRAPHDPSGFVGENHYVQVVNATEIGIYDLEGNLINSYPANNLWTAIGRQSAGDPCVIYDEADKRWIITEFPSGNEILIAVSANADPTGAWSVYKFGTPSFPDYPKTAVWKDYLTLTTNENGVREVHSYVIDKNYLYSDSTEVRMQRIAIPGFQSTGANFLVMTPVQVSGTRVGDRNPLFLRLNDSTWGEVEEDMLEVYSIDVNWDNADSTRFKRQLIPISPYDANPCSVTGPRFTCIPQKDDTGSNPGVDGLPEVIMHQSQYRMFDDHESIVLSFVTDATGDKRAGVRWVELRNDTVGWKLYQEGTFALEDSLHRFMPSIAMDALGNIGLAYNTSSASTYVDLRATGRLASDPLGQMTFKETMIAEGLSTNVFNSRQGDYAHMTVNPAGDRFYFTSEYMAANNIARTKIFSFQLQKKDYDQGVTRVVSPTLSSDLGMENIQMEIRNFGANTLDSFDFSYSVNGSEFVRETVDLTLESDSLYTHTFATPADFSDKGSYDITVVSHTKKDTLQVNDTLKVTIEHINKHDLAILRDSVAMATCADSTSVTYTITNRGEAIRDPFSLTITQGEETQVISYDTMLAYKESMQHTLNVPLLNLENTVVAKVAFDSIMDNNIRDNSDTLVIRKDSTLNNVMINIQMDGYPAELSWILVDDNGKVLDRSPEYDNSVHGGKLLSYMYCVPQGACYTLKLLDSFGDGICCNEGNGNVLITKNGKAILSNNGQFGESIDMKFCMNDNCTLDLKTSSSSVSGEGKKDGNILAAATGGVEPYRYTIDGFESTQSTGTFTDLSAGTYIVEVYDVDTVCTARDTIVVGTCDLSTMYEVQHASSSTAADGKIDIVVSTLAEIKSITLSGKELPKDKVQTVTDLKADTYVVEVKTKDNCIVQDSVVVSYGNSTVDPGNSGKDALVILPNPTKDVIKVVLTTSSLQEVFIPLYLYDASGQLIKQFDMTRYDNTYIIPISLYNVPAGTYYIKVINGKEAYLKKVIRL